MNFRHLRPEQLAGKRWRGLVRESTREQAENWSPDRQRADLIRAAAELGLVADTPRFYFRIGSGEAEHVSELAEALADGKRGEYDVLLVIHTSRFARNRAEAATMKREFRRAGIVIYFVAQRLISGTYAGALTEGINEVIDEHENEQRRFWIAGGIRERQLSGRWIGSVPLGYRKRMADFPDGSRRWDGGLEEDPTTAPIVRRMFTSFLAGATPRTIAFELNVTGARTAYGRPWTNLAVGHVLRNPVYAGRFIRYRRRTNAHYYGEDDPQDGRRLLDVNVPALVDDRVFDEAQSLIGRRHSLTINAPVKRAYPLSLVLRCGSCGSRYTGCHNGRLQYYRCQGRLRGGLCTAGNIRADDADRQFAEWLAQFRVPADWEREITSIRIADARSDDEARRAKLQQQLARLQRLYVLGDLLEEPYEAQAREIKAAMALITQPVATDLSEVARLLVALGQTWLTATDQEARRTVPKLILRAALVRGATIEWRVRPEIEEVLAAWREQPEAVYHR